MRRQWALLCGLSIAIGTAGTAACGPSGGSGIADADASVAPPDAAPDASLDAAPPTAADGDAEGTPDGDAGPPADGAGADGDAPPDVADDALDVDAGPGPECDNNDDCLAVVDLCGYSWACIDKVCEAQGAPSLCGGLPAGLCGERVCAPATGICEVAALPDGADCLGAEDPCVGPGSVCEGGECQLVPPPLDELSVQDFDGATLGSLPAGWVSVKTVDSVSTWYVVDDGAASDSPALRVGVPGAVPATYWGGPSDATVTFDVPIPGGAVAAELQLHVLADLAEQGPDRDVLVVSIDGEVVGHLGSSTAGTVSWSFAIPIDQPSDVTIDRQVALRFLTVDGQDNLAGGIWIDDLVLRWSTLGCPGCQVDGHCDDDDPCTDDRCQDDGTCQSAALECSAQGCATALCAGGYCDQTEAPCDDGDACTVGACVAEECIYETVPEAVEGAVSGFEPADPTPAITPAPGGWSWAVLPMEGAPEGDYVLYAGNAGIAPPGYGGAVTDATAVVPVTPPPGAEVAQLAFDAMLDVADPTTSDAFLEVRVNGEPRLLLSGGGPAGWQTYRVPVNGFGDFTVPVSFRFVADGGDGPLPGGAWIDALRLEIPGPASCFEQPCLLDASCDDGDPCTLDSCGPGGCDHAGFGCDDGDPCTVDVCDGGQCAAEPVVCEDDDPCTVDACEAGECVVAGEAASDTVLADFEGDSPLTGWSFASAPGSAVWALADAVLLGAPLSDLPGTVLWAPRDAGFLGAPTDATATLTVELPADPSGAAIAIDLAASLGDELLVGDRVEVWLDGIPVLQHGHSGVATLMVGLAGAAGPTAEVSIRFRAVESALLAAGVAIGAVRLLEIAPACAASTCLYDGACDDGDPCTLDTCDDGTCDSAPVACAPGYPCSDAACAADTLCLATALVCDDGDPCTGDLCGADGACTSTFDPTVLDFTIVDFAQGVLGPVQIGSAAPDGYWQVLTAAEGGGLVAGGAALPAGSYVDTTAFLDVVVPEGVVAADLVLHLSQQTGALGPDQLGVPGLEVRVDGAIVTVLHASTPGFVELAAPVPGAGVWPVELRFLSHGATSAQPPTIHLASIDLRFTDASCMPGEGECAIAAHCLDGDACTPSLCVAGACAAGADPCAVGEVCASAACNADGSCAFQLATCDDGDTCTLDECAPDGCVFTPYDGLDPVWTLGFHGGLPPGWSLLGDDAVFASDATTGELSVTGAAGEPVDTSVVFEVAPPGGLAFGAELRVEVTALSPGGTFTAAVGNQPPQLAPGPGTFALAVPLGAASATVVLRATGVGPLQVAIAEVSLWEATVTCVEGCAGPAHCDDGDTCSVDLCVDGECVHDSVTCADDDPCTVDTCVAGSCAFIAYSCDDEDPCTVDSCDGAGGCASDYDAGLVEVTIATFGGAMPPGAAVSVVPPSPAWKLDGGALVVDGAASPLSGFVDTLFELPITPPAGDTPGAAELVVLADVDPGDAGAAGAGLEILVDGLVVRHVEPGVTTVTLPLVAEASQVVGFHAWAYGEGGAPARFALDDLVARATLADCSPCVIDAQCPGDSVCSPAVCEDGGCSLVSAACDDGDPCTTDLCAEEGCSFYPIDCDDGDPCTDDACDADGCTHATVAVDPQTETVVASFAAGPDGLLLGQGAAGGLGWTAAGGELVLGDAAGEPAGSYDAAGAPTDATATLLLDVPAAAEAALRVDLRLDLDPADAFSDRLQIEVDGELAWMADATLGTGVDLHTVEVALPAGTLADVVFRFVSDGIANDGAGPGLAELRLVTVDVACDVAGCSTAAGCDDEDPCTEDACVGGACEWLPVACDDADACTEDACVGGLCAALAKVCDDGDPCTADACVEGLCEATPVAEPVSEPLADLTEDPGETWTLEAGEASEVAPIWSGEALVCDAPEGIFVDCLLSRSVSVPAEPAAAELVASVAWSPGAAGAGGERVEAWIDGAPRGVWYEGGERVIPLLAVELGADVTLTLRYTTGGPAAEGAGGFALEALALRHVAEACDGGCLLAAECFTGLCGGARCEAGACEPDALDCADGDACTVDGCEDSTGCVWSPPEGCDDGDPCSLDTCAAGVCQHAFAGGLVELPPALDFEQPLDDAVDVTGDLARTPYQAASGLWSLAGTTGGTLTFTVEGPPELDPLAARAWISLGADATATMAVDGVILALAAGPTAGFAPLEVLVTDSGPITVSVTVDGAGAIDAVGFVGAAGGLDCGASCGWSGPCLDLNPCTDDACVTGVCPHDPFACDDGDPCTEDLCGPEGCTHPPLDCDDADPCTLDACGAGLCEHAAHDGVDHELLADFEPDPAGDPLAGIELWAAPGGWAWQLDDERAQGGVWSLYAGDGAADPNSYDGADTDAVASFQVAVPAGAHSAELRLWLDLEVEEQTTVADVFEVRVDGALALWWGQDTGGFQRFSVDLSDLTGEVVTVELRFVTHGAEANSGAGAWVDGLSLAARTATCGAGCGLDIECVGDALSSCGVGRCDAGECEALPLPCDDGEPCTADTCEAGGCAFGPKCADGNACTLETCVDGTCLLDAPACDDDDDCTSDYCDPAAGCAVIPGLCEPEGCADGDDDNGNGLADCLDPQCFGEPGCGCVALDTLGCGDVISASTAGAGTTEAVSFHFCGGGFVGPWSERSWTVAPAPFGQHAVLRAAGEVGSLFAAAYPGGACDELCAAAAGGGPGETFLLPLPGDDATLVVLEGVEAPTTFDLEVVCVAAVESDCGDQADGDLDGLIDCADPDCGGDAWCLPEGPCVQAPPVGCGEQVALDASDGSYLYEAPKGCAAAAGVFLPGSELAVPFTAPATGPVTVTVTGGPTVLVLAETDGGCDTTACLALGDDSVEFWALAGRTYQLLIDTGFDAATAFELDVACGPPVAEPSCTDCVDGDGDGATDCDDDDCAASAACGPGCRAQGALGCGTPVFASTAGAAAHVDSWPCPGGPVALPGGERAYAFVPTVSGTVTATIDTASGRSVVALRDQDGACNPAYCLAGGGTAATFEVEAGARYLVVVDGADAASTDFVLSLVCPPTMEQHCADEADNDGDGTTDCDDADCGSACQPLPGELACDDGLDDDGDGLTDCADGDCQCPFVPAVCP